ncbi:MAG: 6-phosphogluconolactonase [Candidatus Paceibacterota bacterium]|jgi:6-phosphogluconolactonase/glucosamine-6-phosphate isomerase/deaminase
MNLIKSTDSNEGAPLLANRIIDSLVASKKVLWLIAGGSNIPIAVSVMNMIKKSAVNIDFQNLTIALTDERYGPVGHPDSNWQQLIDHGFDFNGVRSVPILKGRSLEETAIGYDKYIRSIFESVEVVIAQFGIGADGHIAGILPHSPAVDCTDIVTGYVTDNFTRITLTPIALRKINYAFVFAFGESKLEAMKNIRENKMTLADEPAGILNTLPEVYIFSGLE